MPAKVKKGDLVLIRSGKDKGKKEKVLKVFPKEQTVLVEKVNVVNKHLRPSQKFQGGIVERIIPIPLSKVLLVCPRCSQTTRPKNKILEGVKSVRACRRCGEVI